MKIWLPRAKILSSLLSASGSSGELCDIAVDIDGSILISNYYGGSIQRWIPVVSLLPSPTPGASGPSGPPLLPPTALLSPLPPSLPHLPCDAALETPTTAEAPGGSQLTLDCGTRTIRVLWAFWGLDLTWGLACNAPPAALLANARAMCDNRTSCTVDTTTSGTSSWLSYDPCNKPDNSEGCNKPDNSEGCYVHSNNGNQGCIGRVKRASIKYRWGRELASVFVLQD